MGIARTAIEFVMVLVIIFLGVLFWLETNKVRTPFLPHFVFSYDAPTGQLFVQGTWRLEDGDDSYPSQTTTLQCERSTLLCLEASAVIARDLLLPISINSLPITKWDNRFVIVRGVGGLCAVEEFIMDLSSQAVSGVVAHKPGCGGASDKPRRMRMIDGYKESQAVRRVSR